MAPLSGNDDQKGMPGVTYGFIGIGRMGFPMALNLRAKMPHASKLIVCDINQARVEEFLVQSRSLGPVEVAASPREVAERCVSTLKRLVLSSRFHTAHEYLEQVHLLMGCIAGYHHRFVTSGKAGLASVHRSICEYSRR